MGEQSGYGSPLNESPPLSQGAFQDLWENILPPIIPGQSGWEQEHLDRLLMDEQQLTDGLAENQVEFPSLIPEDEVTLPVPTIPDTTDYSGEFDFQLRFQKSDATKSVTYIYSDNLNKLFCHLGKTNAIEVLVGKLPPQGAILRAMAVYKKMEHKADVVHTCPHHQNEDATEQSDHVIRVEGSQKVVYYEDPNTMRHSVTIPYEPPQSGSDMTTILLRYMCNSSCMGGMNRRPILNILTLETAEGLVLGRRCFEVRICASPHRDYRIEEEKMQNCANETKTRKESAPARDTTKHKSRSASSSEEEDRNMFIIHVYGRKRYKAVKEFCDGLDLEDYKRKRKDSGYTEQDGPLSSSMLHSLLQQERSDSD